MKLLAQPVGGREMDVLSHHRLNASVAGADD